MLALNKLMDAKSASQNAIGQMPPARPRSTPAKEITAPEIPRAMVAMIVVSATTHQNQAVGLTGRLARVTSWFIRTA
jgi:hypothetical protein